LPRSLLKPLGLLLATISSATLGGCRCGQTSTLETSGPASERPDFERAYSRLEPPPREDGPPRSETREELERSAHEANLLCRSLRAGGVPGREVASVADIRGYRLYRRRFYGKALAWFEAALVAEPGHELALLNAARAARLLHRDEDARRHLAALARLESELSRSLLRRASTDPDLGGLLHPAPVRPRD
jgi:hypothetical protein